MTAALPRFRSVACRGAWTCLEGGEDALGNSEDHISVVISSLIGNYHVPTQVCPVREE